MEIARTQSQQVEALESFAPPAPAPRTFCNAIPQLARFRVAEQSTVSSLRTPTQSEALWGADFLADAPRHLSGTSGVEVLRGDWDRASAFLRRFPMLAENLAESQAHTSAAKRRYLRTFCDLIECRKDGQTVGVFIGAPEDWSTYYCRVLAVDPSFAVRPLLRRFTRECLERPLAQLGVDRLVGETGATNTAMSRWFIDLGFHVSGQRLTERWGPLTHFTTFLDRDCSQMFAHRYTQGRGDCHTSVQPTGGKER